MSVYKTIQQLVRTNPQLSTHEVYEQVRPQFPDVNQSWLKCRAAQVCCVTRKAIKEKAFLSPATGV